MKNGDRVRIRKITPELRGTPPFVDGMEEYEGRVGTVTQWDEVRKPYILLDGGVDGNDHYYWHEDHLEPLSVEQLLQDAGWKEQVHPRYGARLVHPKDSSCYVTDDGGVNINGGCSLVISTPEQAVRWLAFLEAYYGKD